MEQITTGAGNDIERATAMARQMVTRYGMSDVIGLMAVGQADQEPFLGRELVQRREISEHTAQQVDREIKRVLDGAQLKARSIVTEHNDLLERVAQALLDRETLDAQDILLLDADEELPPLATEEELDEDVQATSEEDPPTDGELEPDAAPHTASENEAEADAEVPTAMKVGEEPPGDEEMSPGTVRAVQISAEDPEADASG
jgi:cell division protease FtsH